MRIDITIVATNILEIDLLVDEDKLLESYCKEEVNGFLNIEGFAFPTGINITQLLFFIYKIEAPLSEIFKTTNIVILDISNYKNQCLTFTEFDNTYQNWIEISSRENTMDEYGMLLEFISYTQRNLEKKFLLLRVEYS
jgi:hypothetical protein